MTVYICAQPWGFKHYCLRGGEFDMRNSQWTGIGHDLKKIPRGLLQDIILTGIWKINVNLHFLYPILYGGMHFNLYISAEHGNLHPHKCSLHVRLYWSPLWNQYIRPHGYSIPSANNVFVGLVNKCQSFYVLDWIHFNSFQWRYSGGINRFLVRRPYL